MLLSVLRLLLSSMARQLLVKGYVSRRRPLSTQPSTKWILRSRTASTISSRLSPRVRRRNSGETNSRVGSRKSAAKTIFEIGPMAAASGDVITDGLQRLSVRVSRVLRENRGGGPPVQEQGVGLLPVTEGQSVLLRKEEHLGDVQLARKVVRNAGDIPLLLVGVEAVAQLAGQSGDFPGMDQPRAGETRFGQGGGPRSPDVPVIHRGYCP